MEYKTDVEHQEHYTSQSVQPIEYMKVTMTAEQYEGYLLGNVIKYTSRYRHKHKNALDDLRKANVYMAEILGYY